MNFLALLLGLGLERVLTRLLHLREFRWLDPLFDRVFRGLGPAGPSQAQLTLLLVALGLAAPVLAGTLLLAAGSQGLGSFSSSCSRSGPATCHRRSRSTVRPHAGKTIPSWPV